MIFLGSLLGKEIFVFGFRGVFVVSVFLNFRKERGRLCWEGLVGLRRGLRFFGGVDRFW